MREFGLRRSAKGSGVSNIQKLNDDFAKSLSLGKTKTSDLTPDQIKKKFAI